ncbi:SET domain-containing protein [Fibrisoma montanum]|nr:SET domain-containing protein-lysine N-methyltransferase [Fibrisoma montanum]
MIHPDTYVQLTPKGLGLFAKKRFLRGEILWIIDDIDLKMPLLAHQALDPLQQQKLNIYCYLDYQHRVIVPWDEGKYVNHSCAPNSTGLLEYDNISIALRTIEPGEEIVEDYYCYYGHFETFTCKCGAPNCRGTIDQVDSYRPDLRLHLDDIAPDMMKLDQPLLAIQSAENTAFLTLLQRYSIPV